MKQERDRVLKKREESLAEILDHLREDTYPILVEGKRDKLALASGGIDENRIYMLHGHSVFEIGELLEGMNLRFGMSFDEDVVRLVKGEPAAQNG